MSDIDYKGKYMKYKHKYMMLRYQNGGKRDNLIVHISGPAGSGKTTLGNRLKQKYGNRIIVMDIDTLRRDFVNREYNGSHDVELFDKDKYQAYIDEYVNQNKQYNKPIIFVGLNNMPWLHPDVYYDMHAEHKLYIKLDDDIIYRQKCNRYITKLYNMRDKILNDLKRDNAGVVAYIKSKIDHACDYNLVKSDIDKWNADYKTQQYEFMSRDAIFDHVVELIDITMQ